MCVQVFFDRGMWCVCMCSVKENVWCVYMCTVTEICEVCICVLLQRYVVCVHVFCDRGMWCVYMCSVTEICGVCTGVF